MTKEIWLLLDSSTFGGIESHVLELATGLKNRVNVRVVILNNVIDNPLAIKLKNNGVKTTLCHLGIVSFIIMLCQTPPLLIHSHGYKSGIVSRIASLFFRFKTISTFHAGESLNGKLKAYDWMDRHSARISSHVFSVSSKISERIPRKNEIIKNFIDTGKSKKSNGTQIAFVGRLSYEKGPDLFSEIAKRCRMRDFHMYGDGPMAKEIEQGRSKNLFLHGRQNEMDCVWKKIGILMVTSRAEGMPMVIIEAMSRGIPVISFDVGEVSHMIDHGKNGWLCGQENIETMNDLLNQWLEYSPEEKRLISENAVNKANISFSTVAVLPRYVRVYEKFAPYVTVCERRG
ncbi:MAG: glycosyltransferase family 4 protein [Agarilytica sp.]